MTEQQDLKRRFISAKEHIMALEEREPTDKEVWEFMKGVAKLRQDEALMDDMEGYVIIYQKRIKLIDEQLEAIQVNEQAEQHKAQTQYENGIKPY